MAKKKGGLGNKGVEVLLSSSNSKKKVSDQVSLNIDISTIEVSPYQQRINFNEEHLK